MFPFPKIVENRRKREREKREEESLVQKNYRRLQSKLYQAMCRSTETQLQRELRLATDRESRHHNSRNNESPEKRIQRRLTQLSIKQLERSRNETPEGKNIND